MPSSNIGGVPPLSEAQRTACEWTGGAFLLLAGPGSGKTTVLTHRVIRLLGESEEETFKILALTFTNRAADEMRTRIEGAGLMDSARLQIGTFHSFAADVLRQAGQNLGLRSNFEIYSRDEDREEILGECVATLGADVRDALRGTKLLPMFDRAATLLLTGAKVTERIRNQAIAAPLGVAYDAFHQFMIKENVQDFSALVLNAYRLFEKFPVLCARYRKTYRYWNIDEFQDTTFGQYRLLKAVAGTEFKNVFAVADDDQIIYQWNGASYLRLQDYITDFSPTILQLPTNYRCPQLIVELANRLISKNTLRQPGKLPLVSGMPVSGPDGGGLVGVLEFADDTAEAEGIAERIANGKSAIHGSVAVLARARYSLNLIKRALDGRGIKARVIQRRNDFQTIEFRWIHLMLMLASRRADAKVATAMTGLFNAISGSGISAQDVIADANAHGGDFLKTWVQMAAGCVVGELNSKLVSAVQSRLVCAQDFLGFSDEVINLIGGASEVGANGALSEIGEDRAAWKGLARDIRTAVGSGISLDAFLQELEFRSKEAPAKVGEVALMTIHSSKGAEFDEVYLLGLAEEVLPSYQSVQKGETSPEMEEERRNCFVAITRTRRRLTLSRAKRYRGWKKAPSRFLAEMELI